MSRLLPAFVTDEPHTVEHLRHTLRYHPAHLREIVQERVDAHLKHDGNGDSMERKDFTDGAWLSVLVEEVGEVAKAMCDHRHHGEFTDRAAYARELRAELVQVLAMASAWVDAIDLHE